MSASEKSFTLTPRSAAITRDSMRSTSPGETRSGAALLIAVALASCGGAPPPRQATPEETAKLYPEIAAQAAVQLSKAEPPPGCVALGTVAAGGWTVDDAYSGLKKKAAERGGNYVVLDGIGNGIFGRVFQCPIALAARPAAPAAAAASACVPDCSPGYVCARSACVSACNPPCDQGQRCDADRTCHLVK
jgi:hypothetical protein